MGCDSQIFCTKELLLTRNPGIPLLKTLNEFIFLTEFWMFGDKYRRPNEPTQENGVNQLYNYSTTPRYSFEKCEEKTQQYD